MQTDIHEAALVYRGFRYLKLAVIGTLPSRRPSSITTSAMSTSEGDFVLDNRRSTVMPWRRLPYAWKIRQSAAAPARWYIIPRG